MKRVLVALSLVGTLGFGMLGFSGAASPADLGGPPPPPPAPPAPALLGGLFPPVVVQLGPTTSYSTIDCSQFTKLPDGSWKAIGARRFGLGFTQGIVPPLRPIKVGSFIYNNIDLFSQLELQCAAGGAIVAKY